MVNGLKVVRKTKVLYVLIFGKSCADYTMFHPS